MTTDNTTLDLSYLDNYQEAAAEPTRLVPGKYYAELPTTITSELRTDSNNRNGIDFNLGALRIVGDEQGNPVRGYVNRFYRVSTLPRGNQQFSDAVDLVKMFGIDPKSLGAEREAWDNAFASIGGQRTPVPIRFDYTGSYKHPISGKKVYLKSKDFSLGDGEYARVGYVIDNVFTLTPTFPDTIGKNDYKAQGAYAKANNWIICFGNFEPGFRAWAAKA